VVETGTTVEEEMELVDVAEFANASMGMVMLLLIPSKSVVYKTGFVAIPGIVVGKYR